MLGSRMKKASRSPFHQKADKPPPRLNEKGGMAAFFATSGQECFI
jgi:hypothetical protein